MKRARCMLDGGVPYLQLRFKHVPLAVHKEEIADWPRQFPATRLIINDDLAFAISVGAWGAHLGQEDLLILPAGVVQNAPLHLGISTHCDAEIERARQAGAAMIGFGPVFATGTKAMKHAPQGVTRLADVVRSVELPVIAIGGIGGANLPEVVATGVAMVAMIGYLHRMTTHDELRQLISQVRGPASAIEGSLG